MSLVLSGERPRAAASSNPMGFVAAWFAKVRTAREQQLALANLLRMDAHRLDDLGINRGDLFDALHTGARPTRLLAERRATRVHY